MWPMGQGLPTPGLISLSGHLVAWSLSPCAEMQSVYSTVSTDWASRYHQGMRKVFVNGPDFSLFTKIFFILQWYLHSKKGVKKSLASDYPNQILTKTNKECTNIFLLHLIILLFLFLSINLFLRIKIMLFYTYLLFNLSLYIQLTSQSVFHFHPCP